LPQNKTLKALDFSLAKLKGLGIVTESPQAGLENLRGLAVRARRPFGRKPQEEFRLVQTKRILLFLQGLPKKEHGGVYAS